MAYVGEYSLYLRNIPCFLIQIMKVLLVYQQKALSGFQWHVATAYIQ